MSPLADTLQPIATYLAQIAMLAVFVSALVGLILVVFKVPAVVARRGVERHLSAIRRRHFAERGMNPSPNRLQRQLRRESRYLFALCVASPAELRRSSLPFWFSPEPWPFDIPRKESWALAKVFPDLNKADLATIAEELRKLREPVSRRFRFVTYSLAFVAAAFIAHGWQLNSLQLLNSLDGGETLIDLRDEWRTMSSYYVVDDIGWSLVVGIWISVIVMTLVSGWMIRRFFRHTVGIERGAAITAVQESAEIKPPEDDSAQLGQEQCAVRAFSFAGGAFDTVMQIGVAHALLTIQGRGPDAVVGISGGAVNAVAIAEIMQTGEEHERAAIRQALSLEADAEITTQNIGGHWKHLTPRERRQIQRQRRTARVDRLRECIEAAQQAPEKLFDALLPDPHQIESMNPLHPLEQPRFATEERDERSDAAKKRTGLVRLYNDILNIPFSVGILVRATRRILGIKAAGEIRDFRLKWAVRVVESIRLWVLLGINLIHAAPLVVVLARAIRKPKETSASTAGTLIFRFRLIDRVVSFSKNFVAFILLLVTWVSITLLPFSIGHLFALVLPPIRGYQWAITTLIYVVVVLPSLITRGRLTEFEKSTVSDLVKGVARTGSILLLLAASWTAVLFVVPQLPSMILLGWFWPWPLIDWEHNPLAVAALLLIPVALIVVIYWNVKNHHHSLSDRLLRSYYLNDAILRVHGLRTFLADLFDPDYYEKPDMDEVVEESLKDKTRHEGAKPQSRRRILGRYSSKYRLEPVHVGVAVANTSTGDLDVVDCDQPVIEALIAALSATPLFRPVELKEELYINGSNVANEPTRALVRYLRDRINEKPGPVHVYSVSPFPMSQAELGSIKDDRRDMHEDDDDENDAWPDAAKPVLNLIDVVIRALRLQRFRDATLERRVIELISRSLAPGDNFVDIQLIVKGKVRHQRFLRTWITPIELDLAANTNARLIGAGKKKRRRRILQTIADGCRASMQVMLGEAIRDTAGTVGKDDEKKGVGAIIEDDLKEFIAPCASVVRRHLRSRCPDESWVTDPLPGSREELGPGLSEICRHCRIWRDSVPEASHGFAIPEPDEPSTENGDPVTVLIAPPELADHNCAHLRQKDWWQDRGPAWPHEREYEPDEVHNDPHFVRKRPAKDETLEALEVIQDETRSLTSRVSGKMRAGGERAWPLRRPAADLTGSRVKLCHIDGRTRPTVSFLFSGGVFRGVYQMGVLTALDQLNLKPDVIAGASVGSITAAMIAETFSIPQRSLRHARIAQLAAVYVAIDRIILTDRFANFVRDLTLRAADTRFSIKQADRLFRKFDHPNLLEFDHNARAVIAGLERLFYINPYQLNEFVRNIRNRDYSKVLSQLREFGQQVLDRMFVGDEVLGADALEDLIEAYVTGDRVGAKPVGLQIDDLRRESGIQFLATTTNLAQGRLEILGERPGQSPDGEYYSPLLAEALLASSAFPGVFRPRWSWELYPDTDVAEQYIDGGVMDNLPLDAVAQFLHRAYKARLIEKKPVQGPHLIIAASLQVNTPEYSTSLARKHFQESWLALGRRAKELQYNTKLDTYRRTQGALRGIVKHYRKNAPITTESSKTKKDDLEILDLEVVAVKPNRLCSTFAFHPMLGFKRNSQKESIAHGCASTLLTFGAIRNNKYKAEYLNAWRIRHNSVPEMAEWNDAFDELADKDEFERAGQCWLTKRPCPFARQSLNKFEGDGIGDAKLEKTTIEEVADIHRICMEPATHLRPI